MIQPKIAFDPITRSEAGEVKPKMNASELEALRSRKARFLAPDEFWARHLKRHLETQVAKLTETLASGSVPDWTTYHEMVGRRRQLVEILDFPERCERMAENQLGSKRESV